MNKSPIITLLTDFGEKDGYVATMKGVILSMASTAKLIDAAHDIAPQDVQGAAWALSQYWRYYPDGAIHIVVIDPGVGTNRHALVAEADGQWFILPDNGLLSIVALQASSIKYYKIRENVHREEYSMTFHGRDVFAYVAGLLASGSRSISDIADPVGTILQLPVMKPKLLNDRIEGSIIHIDRFGNLISSIRSKHLKEYTTNSAVINVGDVEFNSISSSYSDVSVNHILALIGSSDHLEVAVRDGAAATLTGLKNGDKITISGIVRNTA